MNCWICKKNKADSKEHLIKASDIKNHFGEISKERPLFQHTLNKTKRPKKIYARQNNRFKQNNPTICSYCNNTKTQPFDNAWSRIFSYIQVNEDILTTIKVLELKNVFPSNTYKHAVELYLYLMKITGCYFSDNAVPINYNILSKCIRESKCTDHFNVLFFCIDRVTDLTITQIDELHDENGQAEFAWCYFFNTMGVRMSIESTPKQIDSTPYMWNPQRRKNLPILIRPHSLYS